MHRKFLLVPLVSLGLTGAFAYGCYSALSNGAAYQWLRSAKAVLLNEDSSPVAAPSYLARISVLEASEIDADVVMIGDSLTQHGEWGEYFPRAVVANRGVGGDTTAGILRRLDNILAVKPEVAFTMAGVNDLADGGISDDQLATNYRQIVDRLRNNGVKVVVQSTLFVSRPSLQSINPRIARLNEFLRQYCQEGNCVYEELNDDFAPNGTLESDLSWDGLHLNGRGYKVWISQITQHLPVGI